MLSSKKQMETNERDYFKRDISWLSFNYRVLMEAQNKRLPIFDRIKFLAIYSSNLEEFYRIRISEYRHTIAQSKKEKEVQAAIETLDEINKIVSRQMRDFDRLFQHDIIEALAQKNIVLCQGIEDIPNLHREFVRTYFDEEVFPYLQPVLILKNDIRSFLRDNRLYLMVRLFKRTRDNHPGKKVYYASVKIPHAKVPRFIELPEHEGKHYLIFIDDVIAAHLDIVFPGFFVDSSYGIRISRDADFALESQQKTNLVDEIRRNIRKRKIGVTNRMMYDEKMPQKMLQFLCDVYQIDREQCISSGRYRSLEDLIKLPNPSNQKLTEEVQLPLRIEKFDSSASMFNVIERQDMLLCYPYHSFDYMVRFLTEAAYDPKVREIKITQYRVAENSAVINALILAAKNGKKVTVFVELKARFDEENNIETSERMQRAGIHIVYSEPGFKVHAKVALIIRESDFPEKKNCYTAYLSTGNFNEKTAKIYADMGIFTCDRTITDELQNLFTTMETGRRHDDFQTLLISPFNMVDELKKRLQREIETALRGEKAHVILKMNGLQDKEMINALYDASEAGVSIDLIVRGICCLKPEQRYSRNIRVIRLVDTYLEHARIWYFYAEGKEELFLSSADWMKRNLSRRIETAFPIFDETIKQTIITMLRIQLKDNVKACSIDQYLNNRYVTDSNAPIRAQHVIYQWLRTGRLPENIE